MLETRGRKDCFTSEYKNNFIVGEGVDDTFFILVSDTGVGVSHDSISSVFDRFYKVNTVNTDSHLGTGIGLALVKSLVLLHKGSISIFSERGRGTDMVVRLPLDSGMFNESDFIRHQETRAEEIIRTDSEEMATSVEMKGMEDELLHSTKKKILIIEDNEDLRMLIAESLSDEFQVMQAGDGVEALKLIEHTDFDLIISDIMMPNKDGISLCNDIKGDMNTSHIPVILLTAKTSLESKIEGVDSGADLYFEKPVDLTYLKLSIQNIFRNRRQLKEHYAKNYYADSCELSSNEQDNKFLKQFIAFIGRLIGIVGAIKQMVGSGDGQQRFHYFGCCTSGKVVIKTREVGFPIDRLHIAFHLHYRKEAFHAGNSQRQERAAVRHNNLKVGITRRNIAGYHVDNRAGSFGRVLVNGKRRGGNDAVVHRRRLMRVQDDDCLTLVQHLHQRIECFVAYILSPAVGRQLDAVRTELIKCVNSLFDGCIHIGQR